MIVVYPISLIDQDLALKNARWINELGGCKGHECLFISDSRCDKALFVLEELKKAFDHVYNLPALAAIDGWPEGANYFFRIASSWIANANKWPYFFWLEPDAIPLVEGWLDTLESEYKTANKPFMGDRVQVGDIPLHMSGVGFYPNPLHKFSGEAYRAAEIAFDMAGKDQIIPLAHWTELIEHAWKHPQFTLTEELTTQISPKTILFHSSKDGSLIDLVKAKRGSVAAPSAASRVAQPLPPSPSVPMRDTAGSVLPGSPVAVPYDILPTCDIFIRTYPGDYEWLRYCLISIDTFCTGFRKIWIVSPQDNPNFILPPNAEWKVITPDTEDGYLDQQITKLYADLHTDYQADYILHIDSDTIFTQPVDPSYFFNGSGQPVWYYTPYSAIETPWQPITEKFMAMGVGFEFMRRLPMMIPRWLYPRLREFCHKHHGMVITDYIRNQPPRAFSEFNALGAYAFAYHNDKFAWINTVETVTPTPIARQFHSWSGITPAVKSDIDKILGVPTESVAPIKKLPNGLWVLENDQISQWIEQEGRLDHDQNLLPDILKHIRPGDFVVDVGAFIGDHTLAYAVAVGTEGIVHAFEPNPIAYECLAHNMQGCPNVILHDVALSNGSGSVPLSGNNGNHGGVYVGEHMKIADVPTQKLDDWFIHSKVDFIKIDVEGYEPNVLDGAEMLLEAQHPIMVIEVNQAALLRQGFKPSDIFWRLERHGYDYSVIQTNCKVMDPMYDILCVPKEAVVKPVTLEPASIEYAVQSLKEIAARSPKDKGQVMWHLVKAGLKEPNPKNKHKNAKKSAKKKTSAI